MTHRTILTLAGLGAGLMLTGPASAHALAHDLGTPQAPIILAQGGGGAGGGAGEGSGGLQGNTPGSPGTGSTGSTPATLPGTATRPPQGAALPGANAPGGAGQNSAPGAGPTGAPSPTRTAPATTR